MIKDYKKLQQICIDEVNDAGIRPGQIVEWLVNKRAKRRWGLCTIKSDGTCYIEIADRLLSDDRISEKACKETIIHEILHTCRGCKGHTGRWKQYAERMNQIYGYNIKRATNGSEKGVEDYKPKSMDYKYTFICSKCGAIVKRKRQCNFTKYYKKYMCLSCGTPHSFKPYRQE